MNSVWRLGEEDEQCVEACGSRGQKRGVRSKIPDHGVGIRFSFYWSLFWGCSGVGVWGFLGVAASGGMGVQGYGVKNTQ